MDNYIRDMLDEALARQTHWRKQAELDKIAAETGKALSDNLAESLRYRLGHLLIKIGIGLSQTPKPNNLKFNKNKSQS